MKEFRTEQEKFWAGNFGEEYIKRNNNSKIVASNLALFSDILRNTSTINSAIEFGSNIGLNLMAIKNLLPDCELSAVEINEKAVEILREQDCIKVYHQSLLDFIPEYKRDFVLIKTVLIHMNPDVLDEVYQILYNSSNRYICIAEYYNPAPVEVVYRGNKDRLFKRDFAGEMMDKFKDLELINYGFVYHRDKKFPQDDINWFLLRKE